MGDYCSVTMSTCPRANKATQVRQNNEPTPLKGAAVHTRNEAYRHTHVATHGDNRKGYNYHKNTFTEDPSKSEV